MRNLVIITSVINISKNPLDYTSVRSVYTKEERYAQTLETIKSCEKIEDKEILFIETSGLELDKESNIKSKVDFYVNMHNNEEVKKIVNGKSKGSAESTQIWEGIKVVDINDYDNIFKISGRYNFSENFNYHQYNNNKNVFKEGPNQTAIGTAMYKVNKKDFKLYKDTLDFCRKNNGMLEQNFVKFFKNNYITYPKIGVEGLVSVDGNFISW